MTLYELLLFLHIGAAIIWIGSGFLLHVLAFRADRAGDQATFAKVVESAGALGNTVFIPASLATLVFGVLVVIEGSLSFGSLWIVLGLVGYAATFLTGTLIIKPRSDRITEMVQRDGGFTPAATAEAQRMLTLARIDYVVLYLVVADMVLKPTGDDVGVLAAMAVILVAASAFLLIRARAVEAPPAASAPASS